jgi:hypothetical protein
MTHNPYGAGNYTVPSTCIHGMAWSLPCAACNRPDTRPVHYAVADPILCRKLDRIIELLERLIRDNEG